MRKYDESRHELESVYSFQKAYRMAMWFELWGGLRKRPTDLLPFDVVANSLRLYSRAPIGTKQVPMKAIIGSVDRAGDFTRNYLPRKEYLKGRWARVHSILSRQGFDPVSLYKVSDIYFVVDGNHRVSIMSFFMAETVEAEVTEFACRVPLTPGLRLSDLPSKQAYSEFLEGTNLDLERPDQRIEMSHPASYRKLEEHIAGHAYWLEYSSGQRPTVHRAAASWYDLVFKPTMELIRSKHLLRDFPGLTETDLYLGLTEYHRQLVRGTGRPVPLHLALEHYRMTAARPRIRRLWYGLTRRRKLHLSGPEAPPQIPSGRRIFDALPTRKPPPQSSDETERGESDDGAG